MDERNGRLEVFWRFPHLAVHVHDDHCVGVVTNHKVLWVLGQRDHVVDGDFRCQGQRFESVDALAGFRIPNLKR